ncbi:hypothetical protein EVAR_52139_1 [Eumeta japonica]|uniref:Uncharacterized protein n=1 Tax=Eumeta variegata TaxID=151549 RepID=A0A4C1XT27_EUMVA|nr:hypothetical protein EVAR_52139_1 [Eumeta japonica]
MKTEDMVQDFHPKVTSRRRTVKVVIIILSKDVDVGSLNSQQPKYHSSGFISEEGRQLDVSSHALLGSQNRLKFAPPNTNAMVFTINLEHYDFKGTQSRSRFAKWLHIYKGIARAVKAFCNKSPEIPRIMYAFVRADSAVQFVCLGTGNE